eukprot:CAMPEP_0174854310 /NCGR_PEP_ID=MMETSP1114-20130205/30812_1 /TAXON_ID=312471 /ORGANISM="Neobodo designis, Strain CCAP 1951/1" /LENGTH=88 /DNA_ID=CAMNT_0016088995 /DNA_START=522 /DNA_END=788 /DNA_ORIENTATION=-
MDSTVKYVVVAPHPEAFPAGDDRSGAGRFHGGCFDEWYECANSPEAAALEAVGALRSESPRRRSVDLHAPIGAGAAWQQSRRRQSGYQ